MDLCIYPSIPSRIPTNAYFTTTWTFTGVSQKEDFPSGVHGWRQWKEISADKGKSLTTGCSSLQRKPQGVTASLTCSGAVLPGMRSGCVGTWASAKPLFKQTGTEIGMTRESKATKQRWPVRSGLKTGRLWLIWGTRMRTVAGSDSPGRSERCGWRGGFGGGLSPRAHVSPKAHVSEAPSLGCRDF